MTRSSDREDLITLALGVWMLFGLLLDAYAHSTAPELESFWTPWHAIFYAGYIAMAAWIASVIMRRLQPGTRWIDAAPAGYRLTLIGLGVFAVGGVADAIWHSVFGIETSVDALFSPSHLLLTVGLLLILSTPLRAAWLHHRPSDSALTLRGFARPLGSLTVSTAMFGLAVAYAWAPTLDRLFALPHRPDSGHNDAVLAVLSVVVTTLVLSVPMLVVSLRWRLPFGTATIAWGFAAIALPAALADSFVGAPALIVGGLVFDGLIRRRSSRLLLAALPPLVIWVAFFGTVAQSDRGLGLEAEFTGGAIVLAALAAVAVHAFERVVSDLASRQPGNRSGDHPTKHERVEQSTPS